MPMQCISCLEREFQTVYRGFSNMECWFPKFSVVPLTVYQ